MRPEAEWKAYYYKPAGRGHTIEELELSAFTGRWKTHYRANDTRGSQMVELKRKDYWCMKKGRTYWVPFNRIDIRKVVPAYDEMNVCA